ncbi:polyprenol monophosphomannose synthase [Candidatus Peregrinibacteria bacterium]|nr:polyprenol monophosphomannose synthase [Candidatus Peregrinibacteria bacterium]
MVLPTYKEAANLPELVTEIRDALAGHSYEIIVVDDDSPDRTWEVAEHLGPPVRSIRRRTERGLSSAVIEGFHHAKGEYLVVMDADGQHDPRLIPRMIDALKGGVTVAVGSRYIEGGSVEGWIEARHFASRVATTFARLVTEVQIEDPMSGFFALRNETFHLIVPRLRPTGFKILLEVLSWLPHGSTVFEVPLIFRKRRKGESKLSWRVELQYFKQVIRLFFNFNRRASLRSRGLPTVTPPLFHEKNLHTSGATSGDLRGAKVGGKQRVLFVLIGLVVAAFLIPRAWSLRLLYLDAALRARVPAEVQRIAEANGWLLSGVSLRSVEKDRMSFVHRAHYRGEDPEECFTVQYGSSDLQPCAD